MPDILIVEDERTIREGLKRLFAAEGFSARAFRDAESALAAFAERRPDIVLLDIMLPSRNGFCVCEDIRRMDPLVPIMFHTALDGPEQRLRGLEAGADDYVLKTDRPAEMLARVRRALARMEAFRRASSDAIAPIRLGKVEVDFPRMEVRDGRRFASTLTRTEADILRFLMASRGKVVAADEILAEIRGEGFVCDGNTIYVHMANLRKKLGPSSSLLVCHPRSGYELLQ